MKTKFRYVPVQPQNFALTAAEILMATDAELNEYMGVKKYAPYRKDARWDPNRNDKLKDLKSKISERVGAPLAKSLTSAEQTQKPAKKRKGKKERMKAKLENPGSEEEDEGEGDEEVEKVVVEKEKRKRSPEDEGEADETAVATKKKKRRHKKKTEGAEAD